MYMYAYTHIAYTCTCTHVAYTCTCTCMNQAHFLSFLTVCYLAVTVDTPQGLLAHKCCWFYSCCYM